MNYIVRATNNVLRGGSLDAKDEFSFDHPPVSSEQDWEQLLNQTWEDAELLAALIEPLPDEQLWETFVDQKYGSYYRCIQGLIEHGYYHLGQIAIITAMLQRGGDCSRR